MTTEEKLALARKTLEMCQTELITILPFLGTGRWYGSHSSTADEVKRVLKETA